jgi:glycosyltransferase involved in cell wall biosynthesis
MKHKKRMTVSICTPTFNRRPFIKSMIQCFEHQTYPKALIEWIIIDDGTDKIEDMVAHIKQVKYFKYDEKMTLGKKRNLAHAKSSGDILIYMDDDDYYPPERISHAVEMLKQNPKALCAGSSEMHIYFKHAAALYKFGPYGPNHSTAATFAFRRELLKQTSYDETASVAEEKYFLKDYTVPFVQLDSTKTILVFSHEHNSFDKKTMLTNAPNRFVVLSDKTVDDFIKQPELKKFYMEDIDELLKSYEPGRIEHKPDVITQLNAMRMQREAAIREQHANNLIATYQTKMTEMNNVIRDLLLENQKLKETNSYLDNKIRSLINEQIMQRLHQP